MRQKQKIVKDTMRQNHKIVKDTNIDQQIINKIENDI